MFPVNENIVYLAGKMRDEKNIKVLPPFNELVCEFIAALSKEILNDIEAKKYSDVISFGFWCRKGNVFKLKEEFQNKVLRLGWGLVFHIAPSNVPVNFAFSYVFSLLAGNANVVRVPTKQFSQVNIICRIINKLFDDSKYDIISNMTAFIKYERNNEITSEFSNKCDARIIWGGDKTINEIRKLWIPERAIDISFADRYSFCILDIEEIIKISEENIKKLAVNFYNDTYLMDQNACSSPQLVIWKGDKGKVSNAKEKFWSSLYEVVKEKYDLKNINVMDKYTKLCRDAINGSYDGNLKRYGNYIYCIELEELKENIFEFKGKFGLFFEYTVEDINQIAYIVNKKYQTLTYFGILKEELKEFILNNNFNGIDRIVPVGAAMDISIIWDGFDLTRTLSRTIEIK